MPPAHATHSSLRISRPNPDMAPNRGQTMDSKRGRFLDLSEGEGRATCVGRVARGAVPGLHEGETEASMKRKTTTEQEPKIRLALKKETLKDLSPKQNPRGGFIMKDTIIIRTSGR